MTMALDIADFALDLTYEDIPDEVRAMAQTALADALACAVAGSAEHAGRTLREHVLRRPSTPEGSLLGTGERVSVADAALVNSTLVRDLDANDLYAGSPERDTGHFSDAIPTLVAAGEQVDLDGRELIAAIVACYEVQAALAEAYLWMKRGLHSVSQVAWALPAGLGAIRRHDPKVVAHGIGMSGTTAGLVLQSWLKPGSGISDIKAVSTGLVAAGAVRAVELAEAGLTAPVDALETLFERLPSDASAEPIARLGTAFATSRTMIKRWPAQIYLQAVAQAATEARGEIGADAEISEVVIHSHEGVAGAVQGGAGSYRPETRASADHSTPFVCAIVLRDGDLTPATYAAEPWRDEGVQAAMDRVKLVLDPELNAARFERGELGCRLEVRTTAGTSAEVVVKQQTGHPECPLDSDELEAKLAALADPVLGAGGGARIAQAVDRLAEGGSTRELVAECVPARRDAGG